MKYLRWCARIRLERPPLVQHRYHESDRADRQYHDVVHLRRDTKGIMPPSIVLVSHVSFVSVRNGATSVFSANRNSSCGCVTAITITTRGTAGKRMLECPKKEERVSRCLCTQLSLKRHQQDWQSLPFVDRELFVLFASALSLRARPPLFHDTWPRCPHVLSSPSCMITGCSYQ